MKIWKFSASGLLRGVSAAAFAGAVVLGLGLPAQASLIGDSITLEVTVCTIIPAPCTDTSTTLANSTSRPSPVVFTIRP